MIRTQYQEDNGSNSSPTLEVGGLQKNSIACANEPHCKTWCAK